MEINELKLIWNKTIEKQSVENHFNEKEMSLAIQKRSNLVISKIKRRLESQLIIFSLGTLFIILTPYFFNDVPRVKEISMASFMVIVILSIFSLYNRLKNYQKYGVNIKTSVANISKMFKKTLSIGLYIDTIGLTIIGSWFAYDKIFAISMSLHLKYLLLVLCAAIIALISYNFVRRLQYAKYGKHIEILEDCLYELNRIEKA